MFKNYFVVGWRNFKKYKFTSSINIFGLTLGLSCCLLILTYVLSELSYDRYNVNHDRIYRVTRDFYNQNGSLSLKLSTIAPPFGPYLKNDFPDIQKITRLYGESDLVLRYQEKLFTESNAFFADENLFDVFTVKTQEGNPRDALKNPFSVMLSEETAKKYFGAEDPLGKTIRYKNLFNLKVTGVFASFPQHAHVHPSVLISFNTLKDTTVYGEQNLQTDWGNNSFFTYLLLPENYPIQNLEKQFPAFLDRHMPAKNFNGQQPSKLTALHLQKLTDIHLRSHTDYEAEPSGDISRVYIFSAIALFILLIACINYMNLSTARSILRSREIGIRKVVGALREGLIAQFLTESVLITWMATLLALGLLILVAPLLERLTGQQIPLHILFSWPVLISLVFMPFVVGTLAGLYPALFMSRFPPVAILKGIFKSGGKNVSFRQILVVSQFAISIVLIISTLVVFRQLQYVQHASLGINKDHVIILGYDDRLSKKYTSFRDELLSYSGILDASRSTRIPSGRLLDDQNAYTLSGDSLRPLNSEVKYIGADPEYVPVFGLHIKAGRNFSPNYGLDTSNFLINEAAVRVIGWQNAQDALGKNLQYGNTKGHVIGVVNDFHFESLRQQIVPMIFLLPSPDQSAFYGYISVKLKGTDIASSIAHVEQVWNKFLPDVPFVYNFLDERFGHLYGSEERQGDIFMIFSIVAIFIACLGLLGLSAFIISQRVKEIGVRKVLGASVGQIVGMISNDFLRLVAIASLVAFPVAWFVMHRWLDDFAYRTSMPWWVFLVAGMLAGCIALVTISFQAIRAAQANPAKSLRTEG
jgi:putative ABC transport system permease protein